MSIIEKLNKIQTELKAPKGQYNSFGKYKYRSCEDIFEAVKPLLKKYELVLQTDDELFYVGERYYIKATATLTDLDGASISNCGYAREEETKKGMDGSQITGASSSYARKYALNGLFLIDDTKDSDSTNEGEELTEEQLKERANKYVFTKGKKEGQTILQVYESDPKYLQWCLDNGKSEDIKTYIELITDLKRTPIPESEEEQNKKLELMNELNSMIALTGYDLERVLKTFNVESTSDMTIEQLEKAINELNKIGG